MQGVVEVHEWGTVLLEVDGADGKRIIKLHQTLIVPNINSNLFSLQRVINHGFLPVYGEVDGKCVIKKINDDGGYSQVATMTVINGRATLDCRMVENSGENMSGVDSYSAKVELDMNLLHRQLGHSGNDAMQKLLIGGLVRGIDKVKVEALGGTDFCKTGKLAQKPHPTTVVNNKGVELLDLVVVDLAGPNKPQTLGGKIYDMVIVDTFSQRSFVKLLPKKSDAADVLMSWLPLVETLTSKKLKRPRSDNGGGSLQTG